MADTEIGIFWYFLLHMKEWNMGGIQLVTPEKSFTVSTQTASFDKGSTIG